MAARAREKTRDATRAKPSIRVVAGRDAPVAPPKRAPARKKARGSGERLEVDARRAQLVRLGIDLFASRAYDEVSIDELARAARISKGLLYHYFPTKRDFYVATVRAASKHLVDLTATPDAMPPLERAQAGLDAYLDYVAAHAPAYAALMRGGIGSDPEVVTIVNETRELMCGRLLSGLPGVAITPLVRLALRGWIGFCEATSLDWIEQRAVSREALRDMMIELLLATVPIALRVQEQGEVKP